MFLRVILIVFAAYILKQWVANLWGRTAPEVPRSTPATRVPGVDDQDIVEAEFTEIDEPRPGG